MKIYNTLSGKKEEFVPINEDKVSMYTCGVTVYDICHIGHARSLCVFEMMRSFFLHQRKKVTFVRNITDIDDKILNKALDVASKENISIKQAWDKVLEINIRGYDNDVKALGLNPPDYEPKASEYVEKIIRFIEELIKKDYAYVSQGSVYFRTKKYATESGKYGELSNKKIDDLYAGVRKGEDEAKEDATDFVLWKAKKENEVAWNSPWGEGRPGWHIECSVMSTDILGDEFDIHGGGLDLVFPHHENEIAQSCAKTGKSYAKYWVHHGLLSINKQKMSKSLGNFVTISEVLSKYPADVLKMFFFQAHYTSTVDFTWDRLEESAKAFHRIEIVRDKLSQMPNNNSSNDFKIKIVEFTKAFEEAMEDDFNTPKAISVLFDFLGYVNKNIETENFAVAESLSFINSAAKVLTFDFKKLEKKIDIDVDKVEALITQRQKAKAEKNFALADTLRNEIIAMGVIIKDVPGGKTEWMVG